MTVIGTIIGIFAGEHRFLSNFWPAPVRVHGILCPTVEHAYQASKVSAGPADHAFREIVRARTPGEAKRLARRIPFILRPDWDRVRVDVMTGLVEQKFAYGTALAARLVATGRAELREGNHWGDRFWGVDLRTGEGQNWLGQILMNHRDFLNGLC